MEHPGLVCHVLGVLDSSFQCVTCDALSLLGFSYVISVRQLSVKVRALALKAALRSLKAALKALKAAPSERPPGATSRSDLPERPPDGASWAPLRSLGLSYVISVRQCLWQGGA